MSGDIISLDRIYQYIEDSYALDGEEAKTLIESFIESSEAWLKAYDRSTGGLLQGMQQIALNLMDNAAGIGFEEFHRAAQQFERAAKTGDHEMREEAYRTMLVLLGRLKNEFNP